MGETIEKTMTVVHARAALGNTRGLSNEQVDRAQRTMDAFHAAKPRHRACVACGSMIWSEHSANGDAVWACDRCHRGTDLTADEWHAAEKGRRKAADEHLVAAAAAAPKPRDTLRQALAKLADARAEVSRLEAAVPAARGTVSAAQLKHDRANEAAEGANATAAEAIAASFFTGAKPTPALTPAAARAELAAAVDGLVAARNAMVIHNGKITDARSQVGYANNRAQKAARAVIVAERLEPLLTEATESRAAYLETVGRIGWLVQSHMIPNNDRRAHQIVGEANIPPSAWPEARTAGTEAMEAAMTALLNDPEAPSNGQILHS